MLATLPGRSSDLRRRHRLGPVVGVALLAAAMTSCSGEEETSPTVPEGFSAEQCLVMVHGRSDSGEPVRMEEGWAVLSPDGNEPFDEGRVWIYDTDQAMTEATAVLTQVIDDAGCRDVVLDGFSNGAAFVGALVCSGETFDGRLRGAVVDDPVPDNGTDGCELGEGVEVAVYWTGGLVEATAGTACEELGWTCDASGELAGIEEYAARIGVPVTPSIHSDHTPYEDPPEVERWLAQPG